MMRNRKIYSYVLMLSLIGTVQMLGFYVQAQTVNTGQLTISPETVVSTLFDLDNKQGGRLVNDGELYIYAHFNNDGEVSFTQGNEGLTRFEGSTGVQEIMGSQLSRLYHVLFRNGQDPQAFHLFGNLSISGESRFMEGIVLSDGLGGVTIFEEGASHIGTSDISHVDGYVRKNGQGDFAYPIGDGGYFRFAAISSPNEEASSFQAKYFLDDPQALYPREQKEDHIQLINDAEYWELGKLSGDPDVKLTLSWRDVTTPAFILGDGNVQVHIVRWDDAVEQWEDLGGEIDANAQTVTTPVELDDYGVFTMATVLSSVTNMGITKTSFDKSIWEGDDFEYEILVQNNSDTEATNVVVVDNLPPGLSFVKMETSSAFGLMEPEFNISGQTLIWNIPHFMPGDELVIQLTVKAGNAGNIVNLAEVSSTEEDGDMTDNADTDSNVVKSFFIPNVITPNGDRDNDSFEIKGLKRFAKNKIVIFNRWGDHVFVREDYQNDWQAEGQVSGTYFYVLEVEEANGETKEFKGWIQVLK
ncbi:gliding motility-associated C-terminal domain-containing protein [Belliella marina]|uniref:Gliding motility-associated C-terminal domain-containing protein n=1 Tax=Belliella marina TaxID=1644146 RepID=A0ABW4VPV3_9BACT